MKQILANSLLGGLMIILIIFVAGYFLPWKMINWGTVQWSQPQTVTVIGDAEGQEKTQVASFNAGVTSVGSDKNKAIEEVQQKIKAIAEATKGLGIEKEDIKTQNMSIYQDQEAYYEDGIQKFRPGQWRVNNTLRIKLRDVTKASQLTQVLSDNGATDIYGPNFELTDTQEAQANLMQKAIANARLKAEKVAAASNKKLGNVITVIEGGALTNPIFRGAEGMGGGGGGFEPGTGTVQIQVSVTYELK